MTDEELWEHMQDEHGFDGWTFEDFNGTYPEGLVGAHTSDHDDPEASGVGHGH